MNPKVLRIIVAIISFITVLLWPFFLLGAAMMFDSPYLSIVDYTFGICYFLSVIVYPFTFIFGLFLWRRSRKRPVNQRLLFILLASPFLALLPLAFLLVDAIRDAF
jgi:hypothetical protein